MWAIMKKHAPLVGVCLLVLVIAAVVLRQAAGGALKPLFVTTGGILVAMLVLGAVVVIEQYEEKHNGYAFLDVLPLGSGEIVAAKFGTILAAAVLSAGFLIALFSFSSGGPQQTAAARSIAVISAGASLIFAALVYLGIFAFGFTAFTRIGLALLIGLQVLFVLSRYVSTLRSLVIRAPAFLAGLSFAIAVPAFLAVYVVLALAATKIKAMRK
jgi:hypothetical protein